MRRGLTHIRALTVGLLTLFILVAGSCGSDTTGPQPAAVVVVSPSVVDVDEGQTVQLNAAVRSADGSTLSGRVILWTTSDTAIALVSATGVLTGIRDGQATITASSEGRTVSVPANVTGRAATIVLTSPRTSLNEGETVDLSTVVTSQRGTVLTRHPLAWSSSDPAIASVAALAQTNARATGTGHGAASIKASLDGASATVALSVRGKVARIELSTSRLDFVAGQSSAVTARLWSSNHVLLTDRVITTASA